MRVLVCGGRDFNNYDLLNDTLLSRVPATATIIQGGARGADRQAAHWARENDRSVEEYPADWEKYGKRAGYLRNKQMLEEGKPDLVIAFPGGKGTDMMIKLAVDAGVPVEIVQYYDRSDS
jgi:hypothetical protein